MSKSRFDSLLSETVSYINHFVSRLPAGTTLILAFAATLALLVIGIFAVNVVLPLILITLGVLALINLGRDSSRITRFVIDEKQAQNDFETVYLQTVCAELIQNMERAGVTWTFDKIKNHLTGQDANPLTVIQSCQELEWLETDFKAGLVTATDKGILESREFLDWANINSAPNTK